MCLVTDVGCPVRLPEIAHWTVIGLLGLAFSLARILCLLPLAAAAGKGKGLGRVYFGIAMNNSLCCCSPLRLSTCWFGGAQQRGAGAQRRLRCYPSRSERIHLTVITVMSEAPLRKLLGRR